MAKVKDPVCGMMIEPRTAAGHAIFEGQPVYFCSIGCQESYQRDHSPTA